MMLNRVIDKTKKARVLYSAIPFRLEAEYYYKGNHSILFLFFHIRHRLSTKMPISTTPFFVFKLAPLSYRFPNQRRKKKRSHNAR